MMASKRLSLGLQHLTMMEKYYGIQMRGMGRTSCGDLLPDRPGIEVYMCHENKPYGVSLIEGATGKTIWRKSASGDTGRCCAGNVWAGNDGSEFWE